MNTILRNMSSQDGKIDELIFTLIENERSYNHELAEVQQLVRRMIFWKNSHVPLYTRRQFNLIITSMKKHSDGCCRLLEELLNKTDPLLKERVICVICDNLNSKFVANLLSLCEVLSELILTLKVEEDKIHQVDKALIPFKRLVSLNSLILKICDFDIDVNSGPYFKALDLLKMILDNCFEVLMSLEGINFITEFGKTIDYTKGSSKDRDLQRERCKLELKSPNNEIFFHDRNSSISNNGCQFQEIEMRALSSCSNETSSYSEVESTSAEELKDNCVYRDISLSPSPTSINRILYLRKSLDESPLYQTIREGDEDYLYEEIPFHTNYFRTLWTQLDPVISSGILNNLTSKQIVLQEAKFEIITSEVSYFKSLCILIDVFCESTHLNHILSKEDKAALFSNIIEVKKVSEKFLEDLDDLLSTDLILEKISCIVRAHAVSSFRVYIKYCAQQMDLHNVLQILFATNEEFVRLIKELEWEECQGYSLISFLTLPLQRVTRLPLLMDAVLKKLSSKTAEYHDTKVARDTLNKLVEECNQVVAIKSKKDTLSKISLKFSKSQREDGKKGITKVKDWAKKAFYIK